MSFPAAGGPDADTAVDKASQSAPSAPTWHSIKPADVSSEPTDDQKSPSCGADENLSEKEKTPPEKSSSSGDSTTSTIEYNHTPFDEFRLQVEKLCQILWSPPANPSRVERLMNGSNNRIVGILRGKKIRSTQPFPPPKKFVIERLRGGGYNRVIGITIINPTENPIDVVLRVPRWESEAQLDRDIAILRLIRQYTSVPVPGVTHVDLTSNNPLKSPYVIQDRIPGHDLQQVGHSFPTLSHEQQCTFAKAFGRILSSLLTLQHPYPGLIEASTKDDGTSAFTVRPFEVSAITDTDIKEEAGAAHRKLYFPFFATRPFGVRPKPEDFSSKEAARFEESTSTYYFMIAQFGRWRAIDLQHDPATIGWVHNIDRLVMAAGQMDRLGFLGDDQNCVCHLDLNVAPRNVMVDIDKGKRLTISGILDWDSTVVAPKFVGCVPPMWIWAWNYDGDEDEREANDTPKTLEQQELKRLFEDAAGPEFLKYAYDQQYRLARTLFMLAMKGLHYCGAHTIADEFLEEWETMYETYLKREDEDLQSQKSLEYADATEGPQKGDAGPEMADHKA